MRKGKKESKDRSKDRKRSDHKKESKKRKKDSRESRTSLCDEEDDDDDDNVPRSIITGKKILMHREMTEEDKRLEQLRIARRQFMNSQF
jgi:hypothetical protein